MIPYLIMGAGTLVAVVAIFFAGVRHEAKVKDAEYAPKIERLQKDKATAEAANVSLQGDVDHVRSLATACSAQVATLSKVGTEAQQAVAAAIADAAKRQRTIEARIAGYASAASSPSTEAPAVQCAAARTVLGDVSDRMREVLGLPPVATAPAAVQPAPAPAQPAAAPVQPPAPAVPPAAAPAKKPLPPAVRGVPVK